VGVGVGVFVGVQSLHGVLLGVGVSDGVAVQVRVAAAGRKKLLVWNIGEGTT
jgi:hypothetical protein